MTNFSKHVLGFVSTVCLVFTGYVLNFILWILLAGVSLDSNLMVRSPRFSAVMTVVLAMAWLVVALVGTWHAVRVKLPVLDAWLRAAAVVNGVLWTIGDLLLAWDLAQR